MHRSGSVRCTSTLTPEDANRIVATPIKHRSGLITPSVISLVLRVGESDNCRWAPALFSFKINQPVPYTAQRMWSSVWTCLLFLGLSQPSLALPEGQTANPDSLSIQTAAPQPSAVQGNDPPKRTLFNGVEVPPMKELNGEQFNMEIKDGYWYEAKPPLMRQSRGGINPSLTASVIDQVREASFALLSPLHRRCARLADTI